MTVLRSEVVGMTVLRREVVGTTLLRRELAGMTVLVYTVIARRSELSKKVQAGLRRSNLLAKGECA